jgi:putative membrane protein
MAKPWQSDGEGEVWKGLAAGIAGGLLASWIMNLFQAAMSRLDGEGEEQSNEGEDATVKTAERVSRGVFDHKLSKEEKKTAGPAVHYAMGAVSGGIYGAVSELLPVARWGLGLPFGAAVWLIADEVALPALGLSKKPNEYPPSVHAKALASHLVYGLSTDLVRRGLRRAMAA